MDNNVHEILEKITTDHLDELKEWFNNVLPEIDEHYSEDLRMLICGPHFDKNSLEQSGIKMKYSCEDIIRTINSLGISFDDSVTKEDVIFAVNYLYCEFFPLIGDISSAVKFAEKYIKDSNWPIECGKTYSIWRYLNSKKK